MIGKPKYKEGDIVRFKVKINGETEVKEGVVATVDQYGTFEYDQDVSYDIMVDSENCLYKHFPEPTVIKKIGKTAPPF